MIRLDLSSAPKWLDLGTGLRLQVLPVTTAIMVAARNDPAVEALPEAASKEEMALVMAKAVARRVVTGWEGVGDADGKPVPVDDLGLVLDSELRDRSRRSACAGAYRRSGQLSRRDRRHPHAKGGIHA